MKTLIMLLLSSIAFAQGGRAFTGDVKTTSSTIPGSQVRVFTECGWGNAFITQTIYTVTKPRLKQVSYVVDTEVLIKYDTKEAYACAGTWINSMFYFSDIKSSESEMKNLKKIHEAKAFEALEFLKTPE